MGQSFGGFGCHPTKVRCTLGATAIPDSFRDFADA